MSDLISRQVALEVLDDYAEDIESGNLGIAYSKARMSMCAAPSVEPERKMGKWEYTTHHGRKYMVCSQCGAERIYDHSTGWNYCPCCGVKMELEEVEE